MFHNCRFLPVVSPVHTSRVLGGQPVAEKKKKQQQEEKKEEEKMLLKTPQKLLKTGHYIELGSYQHWPVLIPQRIRLYTYEQIPLFLKENPFITGGYRAHLPSKLCLRRWVDDRRQ